MAKTPFKMKSSAAKLLKSKKGKAVDRYLANPTARKQEELITGKRSRYGLRRAIIKTGRFDNA